MLNDINTNCFVVQKGREAVLVDPTARAEVIIDYLAQHRLTLKYMIATHAHFDHVSGAADMIESGLVDTLYVHEKDFAEVRQANAYSLMIFKKKMKVPQVTMFSTEVLDFMHTWGMGIEHAGGHTRGSCYIYGLARDFVITGDLALNHNLNITLFNGRDNTAEFYRFIERVKQLFKYDTVILPGHGDKTTVGVELKKNKKWTYVQQKEKHGH